MNQTIRSGKNNSFFGKHHTEETKKKIGDANRDEKSSSWKGDKAGYVAIHVWVKRRLPKPLLCPICKKRPPRDLANISQEYKRDITDFEWLCRSCHIKKEDRWRDRITYTRTEEHKRKMSNILKGRKKTSVWKLNLSIAKKLWWEKQKLLSVMVIT